MKPTLEMMIELSDDGSADESVVAYFDDEGVRLSVPDDGGNTTSIRMMWCQFDSLVSHAGRFRRAQTIVSGSVPFDPPDLGDNTPSSATPKIDRPSKRLPVFLGAINKPEETL